MIKVLGTLLTLALVTAGQPASKPNFSGEWTMNAAKSTFGALPPPTSMIRKITHEEPVLTIVEEQTGAMGDQSTTRKYKTDGSPSSFEVQGTAVATSATWNETALLFVSSVEAVGLTFNDRMSLSPDGKTLTSVVRVQSPQGDVELTVVFDKK